MSLEVAGITGIGEVRAGDDLVTLLLAAEPDLRDGDVVVVTSKVVSKALGLVEAGDRDDVVERETVRVVARRGATRIVRTRAGLTLAAAGVDASNTDPGTVLRLPDDPDGEARALRDGLHAAGLDVAVVVSDTAGRPWRHGQTDLAIGSAGLRVLDDLAGTTDPYGNPLHVTASAIADEVASAADLVAGKTSGIPFVVVRGLERGWVGDTSARATDLVRSDDEDLFGLGARDAVEAVLSDPDPVGFGAAEPDARHRVIALAGADPGLVEIRDHGDHLVVGVATDDAAAYVEAGRVAERLRIAARAHRVVATVLIGGPTTATATP